MSDANLPPTCSVEPDYHLVPKWDGSDAPRYPTLEEVKAMTPEYSLECQYAVATWQIIVGGGGVLLLGYFAGYVMGRLDKRESI